MSRVGVVGFPGSNPSGMVAAFGRIGVDSSVLGTPSEVRNFDRLVLPGVGSFGPAADFLHDSGFGEVLLDKLSQGWPVLGVCLGFHLLCSASEEGSKQRGLGIIDAQVMRLASRSGRRVPHMGWSTVQVPAEVEISGLPDGELFYFAHSFEVIFPDSVNNTCTATYGGAELVAAFRQGSFLGVQFHPEKSNESGLALLKGFAS